MSDEIIKKGYAGNSRTATTPNNSDYLGIQQGVETSDMKKIEYQNLIKPVVGEGWDGTTVDEVIETATNLQTQVDSLAEGGPHAVYETYADLIAASPDTSYIYVVTGDGNWYYYDEATTTWTSGGVYNDSTSYNDMLERLVTDEENISTNAQAIIVEKQRAEGVEGGLKNDISIHKTSTMPHEFKDLKENKTYSFGFQLSVEGNPQIITEEIV